MFYLAVGHLLVELFDLGPRIRCLHAGELLDLPSTQMAAHVLVDVRQVVLSRLSICFQIVAFSASVTFEHFIGNFF
jgi:hypothetical protein